jgi:hypothetical protein
MRVLTIDDHPIILESCARLLPRVGVTTQAGAHIEQMLVYPLRAGIPSRWKKMQFPDASGART